MISILGPTATGKTQLAAQLAYRTGAEIISADSRQVYRGMNLGTGKDYEDYMVKGQRMDCHLIDIAEPGTEYNVFNFRQDFQKAYDSIMNKNKPVILCGGTGMYLEAVLKAYRLTEVPANKLLRQELEVKTQQELNTILLSYGKQHNNSDLTDKARTIRAIEIKKYMLENPEQNAQPPHIGCCIFGIYYERETIRKRITERLKQRLSNGLTEEVRDLINNGLSPERLIRYGLEYKYITLYIINRLTYDEMFTLLNIAIHQFAKRQMTWFRRMERQGMKIHWIDGEMIMEKKLEMIEKEYRMWKTENRNF